MFITSVRLDQIRDESYILHLPVVQHLEVLDELRLRSPVTIFVGDNGAGKSTLVEAIALAAGFEHAGGPIREQSMNQAASTHSNLSRWMTLRGRGVVLRGYFLRAETHYDTVTAYDSNQHHKSHGESVLSVLGKQVDGAGLYIFDEPESGLSAVHQMALLAEIQQAVARGGQFIIATHSPIILAAPGATIVEISAQGLAETTYDEVEAVIATREFLDDPAGTLAYILEDLN